MKREEKEVNLRFLTGSRLPQLHRRLLKSAIFNTSSQIFGYSFSLEYATNVFENRGPNLGRQVHESEKATPSP
jgi:hypothetical protein